MAAKKRASGKTSKTSTKARARAEASKAAPKRMGRPPKVPGGRTAGLTIRLHPNERGELEDGARAFGMTVTDFVMRAVRELVARSA